jgi:hypothetical protein
LGIRTKSACCALIAVVAMAGLALGDLEPVANAATDTGSATVTVNLPLTTFSSVVADSVHQHVFVSGGSGSSGVVVTDFAGNPVTTLTSLAGASGLALSANGGILYAAISGTDEIAAVNTATLREVAIYFTDGEDPVHLAVVGNDVWFSYASSDVQGGIGVLDPAALTVGLTTESAFYYAPVLAASPAAPDTLVAGNEASSPSVIESFNVGSGAPVVEAESDPWSQPDGCENLQQLAIAADGTDVIAACGAPYYGSSLNLSTMTEDATYSSGPYPGSVAVAPTGEIALGIYGAGSTVDLFTPNDSTPIASYTFGGSGVYGLAWSTDGGTLFAVTQNRYQTATALNIINVAG